ncbi:hypothetical protein [Paenibacillus donghaensis]|uniref:PI3K/PI4K catalytic domain-containing protein n=1 Tax=Paenibacillus donghaensis TaxID=414771 RepID=A0A2Z2KME2_9BACL|nr:hypothetical protein [Paenibacillus donghaensis]ASA19808.1 hypothetical protein B9T62_02680 [Paenibacillus donghaensis]
MLEHIEVDAFVKVLGDNTGGMSRPVQVIGSNGKEYVLKNQNVYDPSRRTWVEWDSMFIQEVLVHRIAKHFGITVPDCAIANVDSIFLTHAPALRFTHNYVPGFHFASNLVDGVENNLRDGYETLLALRKPYIKRPWSSFFNNISNKSDVSKIVILDLLTANFDRFGNFGNLIIATNNGERLMYCIDHGHCFWGPAWSNLQKRQCMLSVSQGGYIDFWTKALTQSSGGAFMSGLGEIFRALDQYIDVANNEDHCFYDIVLEAEKITPALIDSWFSGIPDEWYKDKLSQIDHYKHFIMNQKQLLRELLNIMADKGAFQTHLGGELKWNVKPTGTQ